MILLNIINLNIFSLKGFGDKKFKIMHEKTKIYHFKF